VAVHLAAGIAGGSSDARITGGGGRAPARWRRRRAAPRLRASLDTRGRRRRTSQPPASRGQRRARRRGRVPWGGAVWCVWLAGSARAALPHLACRAAAIRRPPPRTPNPNPTCADFIADQKGVPRAKVSSWTPHAGGAPCNVAAGLAKLGVRVLFVSALGTDDRGEELMKLLRGELAARSARRTARSARRTARSARRAPLLARPPPARLLP